ncbi:MAG: palindromic element RPE2 domain-containing protein, partial [Rickettsia endosymbiont of Platyusa sonomae]|nr:palindromic element RPE2 domain-containing protein [Rickettsia endosymbiont of Platyusa sonomae]
NRLNALLDVAEGLRYSQNLSLSAIGRNLSGDSKVKHKIKKVDRCIGIVNSGEFGARNDGATPISNRRALSDDVTNFSSIDYNKHLYNEVDSLYSALSYFIFEYTAS